MAQFLCIHGAFQGGWVFSKLADALRPMGHVVHAPTLSGCGYHSHLQDRRLGLDAFCRDVIAYCELEDLHDCILVGHSYSGLICLSTLPALRSRLAGAVFIETIMPEPGRSFFDLGGEVFQTMVRSRLMDEWLVKPWQAGMFGLAEGSPAAEWFMSRVAPFPLTGFTDPIPSVPYDLPENRHYIRCAQNPNPMLLAMAVKAEGLGFMMHSIPSGHCPQMTVPDLLAAKLSEIAAGMAGAA